MDKCIFSVAPIDGFKSVPAPHGHYFNVSQNELARDSEQPTRPLLNVRLRSKHDDDFWGPGKDYISPVMNNPSWRKVLGLATKSMKVTGDYHHCFLEAIRFSGEYHKDGSEYVDIWMGS